MASIEGHSAARNRNAAEETKKMRIVEKKQFADDDGEDADGNNNDSFRSNSSPEKIRQMLAEKDEFILNLEKKLGDVMEELAVMRGEQSKWQRKYKKQEEFIAQCQDIIKTYESKFQNDSPARQRSNQGNSPLQAGALSSLNRQYYQKINSPISHTPKKININERRDQQQQSRQYINNGYDPQEEFQGYAQSEKKHSKKAEPRKYIVPSEEFRFYSEQKVVKGERQQYHNPSGFFEENPHGYQRKQQLNINQQKQYMQEMPFDGNIFSNRKSNDVHTRLQSTPNVSLIKIPFSKLQKLSSKEVKHRLHLIPEAQVGLN